MGDCRLEAIAMRSASRDPMTQLTETQVTSERGVTGDLRGSPGPRQVTVLSAEAWQAACDELGTDLPWHMRRSNFLIRGVNLAGTAGSQLRIGEVLLEITRETDPCARMDEQHPGLQQALTPHWRGGVCCRVRSGGTVRIGDRVELARVAP
jgi:MOSC domain-containing protein YiiM